MTFLKPVSTRKASRMYGEEPELAGVPRETSRKNYAGIGPCADAGQWRLRPDGLGGGGAPRLAGLQDANEPVVRRT